MGCAGLSLKHLSPILAKALGRLSANDERYYPDTLAHIFVVEVRYIFKALSFLIRLFLIRLFLIRLFLAEDTLSEVHVSSGIQSELVDFLGSDCLSDELGGSRRSVFPYDEAARPPSHPITS